MIQNPFRNFILGVCAGPKANEKNTGLTCYKRELFFLLLPVSLVHVRSTSLGF